MNKLVTSALGVTVGVILLSALLVPVLVDASADTDTLVNDGYFGMQKYTDSDSLELHWNLGDPTVFEVNGEPIKYVNTAGFDISVMLGPQFAVRINSTGATCQFYGNGTYVSANAANPDLTVTYTEGNVYATNGTNTKNITGVSEVYCIASEDNAPYTMKRTDSIAYLKDDSSIFASGMTYFGTQVLFGNIVGTVDNLTYSTGNYTISNKVVNVEDDPNHIGTVKLESIEFDATNSAGTLTNHVIYSYFVVPHEIISERTVQLGSATVAVLMAIPVLVIVGLLGLAINIRNRD